MKTIFHKIATAAYTQTNEFSKGNGFYLVTHNNGDQTDVHFWNGGMWLNLGFANVVPPELLKLFEQEAELSTTLEQKENSLLVTEGFFLKAMAMAKVNTQTIKLSDILDK